MPCNRLGRGSFTVPLIFPSNRFFFEFAFLATLFFPAFLFGIEEINSAQRVIFAAIPLLLLFHIVMIRHYSVWAISPVPFLTLATLGFIFMVNNAVNISRINFGDSLNSLRYPIYLFIIFVSARYFYLFPDRFNKLFSLSAVILLLFGFYQIIVPFDWVQALYSEQDTMTIFGLRINGTFGFAYNFGAFLTVVYAYFVVRFFIRFRFFDVIVIVSTVGLIFATQARTSLVVLAFVSMYLLTIVWICGRNLFSYRLLKSSAFLVITGCAVWYFVASFGIERIVLLVEAFAGVAGDGSVSARIRQIDYALTESSKRLFLIGYGSSKDVMVVENAYLAYLLHYGLLSVLIYLTFQLWCLFWTFKIVFRNSDSGLMPFFIAGHVLIVVSIFYSVTSVITDAYRFSFFFYFYVGALLGISMRNQSLGELYATPHPASRLDRAHGPGKPPFCRRAFRCRQDKR